MADTAIPVCPGPDADPRPPRFEMPDGACDTHAHVFGPEAAYPYSPSRGYTPPDASFEAYSHLHATLGIARGVLTQPSVYGTDNRAMLDAMARAPDRLRGVAAVDADVGDDELERLDGLGVRGLRLNLVDKGGMPLGSFDAVHGLAQRLAPMGWHIEFLVHVHEFPDLRATLGALPVDVVIGHLGYMPAGEGPDHPGFQDLLALMRDGRCWVKLTGAYRISGRDAVPYDDVAPLAHALIDTAPDRVVWGSDWPHPIHYRTMPNDGELLDHLADWAPDPAVRRKILVDNPARLYGF